MDRPAELAPVDGRPSGSRLLGWTTGGLAGAAVAVPDDPAERAAEQTAERIAEPVPGGGEGPPGQGLGGGPGGGPALDLPDLALRRASAHDPGTLAMSLAPGVHQLRAGGRDEVAARVAARCRTALSGPAADVFEVIAAPGPALVPWSAAVGSP